MEKESGTFKYFLKIVPTEYINLKSEPAVLVLQMPIQLYFRLLPASKPDCDTGCLDVHANNGLTNVLRSARNEQCCPLMQGRGLRRISTQ